MDVGTSNRNAWVSGGAPTKKKNIFFVAYGLSGAQKSRFSCFVAPDKQQIHRDVAAHCMYRNMTSAAKLSERELYVQTLSHSLVTDFQGVMLSCQVTPDKQWSMGSAVMDMQIVCSFHLVRSKWSLVLMIRWMVMSLTALDTRKATRRFELFWWLGPPYWKGLMPSY